MPYALCPLPGEPPADLAARECCRHFAFAVPPGRPAFAVEDRMATIVASPRLLSLPETTWQAIVAHELGHAVDFYLFGSRYRLRDHRRDVTPDLAERLVAINAESDPELRADALGELLVLEKRGQKLCYDPVLTLQTLVPPGTLCGGSGSGSELMHHFTHAPLQGSPRKTL